MLSYRPRLEVLVLIGMLIVFGVGLGLSYSFLNISQPYPRIISIIGICLTLIELTIFVFQVYRVNKFVPNTRTEFGGFLREVRAILPYVVWILFYFLLIYLVGLIIASGIWTALFLAMLGKMKWYKALIGGIGIGIAAFLIVDLLTLALPTALFDPFEVYRRILRLPF